MHVHVTRHGLSQQFQDLRFCCDLACAAARLHAHTTFHAARMKSALLIAISCGCVRALEYGPAALADQITSLPGLDVGALTFNMFSGYIDVNTTAEPRSLFYWYVEAQTNPDDAPLLLWTNGGPGCSGLSGFMTEQGPFEVDESGTLTPRPYTWTKFANMVFIEQPAGVGFSRAADGETACGDARAASDNANFVERFLVRYPALASKPFYLTSESYGGHCACATAPARAPPPPTRARARALTQTCRRSPRSSSTAAPSRRSPASPSAIRSRTCRTATTASSRRGTRAR